MDMRTTTQELLVLLSSQDKHTPNCHADQQLSASGMHCVLQDPSQYHCLGTAEALLSQVLSQPLCITVGSRTPDSARHETLTLAGST
jgi:hypothetical protein